MSWNCLVHPHVAERKSRKILTILVPGVLVVVITFAVIACFSWNFTDSFIFLFVEESSSSVLRLWPQSYESVPEAIIDVSGKSLIVPGRKNLFGVGLGIYRVALSQGIQFFDELMFSRTIPRTLRLSEPLFLEVLDPEGEPVQAVDNSARIILSDLKVLEADKNGRVKMEYGEKQFILSPGESYCRLLVKTPDGIEEIPPDKSEELLGEYLEKNYPVTRLTIVNYGLWLKSNVKGRAGE